MNSPIPEGKVKKNRTKARPKLNRANIKSCSLASGEWDMRARELCGSSPHCSGLPGCSLHGLSLGLALLTACSFIQQMSQVPSISNFLRSSPHLQLHYCPFRGSWWFLRCPQGIFLLVLVPRTHFLLNGANLFSKHNSFGPNFHMIPFRAKPKSMFLKYFSCASCFQSSQ